MTTPTRTTWVGLLCDSAGVTAFATDTHAGAAQVRALVRCALSSEALRQEGRCPELEAFVAGQALRGCEARLVFAGAGTLTQTLRLPAMSPRHRRRAIETRLRSFAGGRALLTGFRMEGGDGQDAVRALAAAVELPLARGWFDAATRAGLRVTAASVAAAAFGSTQVASEPRGALAQLIVGEHTTTLQVFVDGELRSCRDVLLGRVDFVKALQRPILTDEGPVTLSAEQADALLRNVGVPLGREGEVLPGIPATRLWPVITPPLQRLRGEVEQSLAHSKLWAPSAAEPGRGDSRPAGGATEMPAIALSVLSLPEFRGLGEYLVEELPDVPWSGVAGAGAGGVPAALERGSAAARAIDLRPPEERFTARLQRPALAAGLCSLLIVLANAAAPRDAAAQLSMLRPLEQAVEARAEEARLQRRLADRLCARDAELRERRGQLERAAPRPVPVAEVLKLLFESVPESMELARVELRTAAAPATVELLASHCGQEAASIVATRWAEALAESPLVAGAEVLLVGGSGQKQAAAVQIRVTLF